MKEIIALLTIAAFTSNAISQDNSPRWTIDPRTSPIIDISGSYSALPSTVQTEDPSAPPRKIVVNSETYSVGPNFRIHPRSDGTQSETPLTRHPTNAFLFYGSANTFQGGGLSTGTYLSSNSGFTWKGNDTLIRTGNIPIFNGGDPAPAINARGNYMISYLTSALRMGVSYSTNQGASFSNTIILPGSSSSTDKNMSATDEDPASPYFGRMYTVYTEFAGANLYKIMSSYSTNGGLTWSTVTSVSPAPSPGYFNLGCDIKVGPGGVVYVVWAHSILNGQNSTEDWMGFAKSNNGGASYSYTTNFAVDMNGIRTGSLFNGIRCNGFPRIDVDMTNCSTRGNIYVATGEKYFLPADGVADIVLNTSTDQGLTWSRTKVNQNFDPNSYEYLPAIRVDETGDVNVCYYSTRNSASNTEAEVYLSRSTDAGVSFSDLLVSDHNFTPSPIGGLAAGYQGDYIGITSGNGKVWPFWCENGYTGRYQAWTSYVNITGKTKCLKNVNGPFFVLYADFYRYWPPRWLFVLSSDFYAPEQGVADTVFYWSQSPVSAYGIDSGSGKFNSYIAPVGESQPMESFEFIPTEFNGHLIFDYAYAPNSNSLLGPDSLTALYSTDGGLAYYTMEALYGHSKGGTLNTAPPISTDFTPNATQWKKKIYPLPPGTNKIKLRPYSGNGNSIYVDNIQVRELDPPVFGTLTLIPEGYYNIGGFLNNTDTVRVYLQMAANPLVTVDSSISVIDQFTFTAPIFFPNALDGNYYLKIVHRNSIETWSKAGGETYTRGLPFNYNIATDSTNAYGGNVQRLSYFPDRFGLFAGDVNRDGTIDASDTQLIDNDAYLFLAGYLQTDLTGDNFVDGADALLAGNNAVNYVSVMSP